MADYQLMAEGLRFPEAPVVMDDGSVIVAEIEAARITRCYPDGRRETVAETGGGPNGLAFGPDGKLYCCNNGGFHWVETGDLLFPQGTPPDYAGGSIQRIDIQTGTVETLYKSGDQGVTLRGPNDIVFDHHGGFWFTDHGKTDHQHRTMDIVGVFYAKTDGTFIEEVIFPSQHPNGIGLSPDGNTLYVAESFTCRLMKFDLISPGKTDGAQCPSGPGTPLYRPAGYKFFDSLGMEANGNICVATIGEAGISVVATDGLEVEFMATDDLYTTNIAFGGKDGRDAYITLSSTGRLIRTRWPRPGLRLAYNG